MFVRQFQTQTLMLSLDSRIRNRLNDDWPCPLFQAFGNEHLVGDKNFHRSVTTTITEPRLLFLADVTCLTYCLQITDV